MFCTAAFCITSIKSKLLKKVKRKKTKTKLTERIFLQKQLNTVFFVVPKKMQ